MKLHITNDKRSLTSLWPIFNDSYQEFMGEETRSRFDKIIDQSFAATIIYDNNNIKSFCLHRAIECPNPHKPIEYLSDTPFEFRKKISNLKPVLTIEWLTVAKEYLGAFTKVQPVDLTLGSSFEFMRYCGFGGAMGYSRQDIKTDKVTMRLGTQIYGEVERFNLKCSIMFVAPEEVKTHPVKPTAIKIEELWNSRINELSHLEQRKAS